MGLERSRGQEVAVQLGAGEGGEREIRSGRGNFVEWGNWGDRGREGVRRGTS